jgi:hypothetical protein
MKDTVTKLDVYAAADVLAADGKMPSILLIRKALGDRGSETTLNKHLRQWKAELLQKNNQGCIFCYKTEKENKELEFKVTKYESIVNQLKDCLITMLENPDRSVAVNQIIGMLQ